LKRHWWAWSAAAIVIALIVFVSIRMMPSPDRVQAAVSPELARVQDAAGWRLGTASDFDPDFVQWLREAQVGPSATVLLNLGDDHVRTIGHFLVRADGTRRLAIVRRELGESRRYRPPRRRGPRIRSLAARAP
jgi:hypothetical protein